MKSDDGAFHRAIQAMRAAKEKQNAREQCPDCLASLLKCDCWRQRVDADFAWLRLLVANDVTFLRSLKISPR